MTPGRPASYAEHVAFFQRQQLNRKRHQTELGVLDADAPAVEPPAVVIEPPDEDPAPVEQPPADDIAAPAPAEQRPAEQPPADDIAAPAPAEQPPADDIAAPAPAEQPPADDIAAPAPAEQPPAAPAPAEQPPAAPAPAEQPSSAPGEPTGRHESTTRSLTVAYRSTIMDRTIRLRLLIESGPDAGIRFALPEGEFVIGRDSDVDLRLRDDTVSHYHAKLVVTARRATVEDLGSLNGTQFGTQRLRGVAILSPGDRISFGSTQIRVAPGDSH